MHKRKRLKQTGTVVRSVYNLVMLTCCRSYSVDIQSVKVFKTSYLFTLQKIFIELQKCILLVLVPVALNHLTLCKLCMAYVANISSSSSMALLCLGTLMQYCSWWHVDIFILSIQNFIHCPHPPSGRTTKALWVIFKMVNICCKRSFSVLVWLYNICWPRIFAVNDGSQVLAYKELRWISSMEPLIICNASSRGKWVSVGPLSCIEFKVIPWFKTKHYLPRRYAIPFLFKELPDYSLATCFVCNICECLGCVDF